MKIVIIIPTYNECENIERLLEKIVDIGKNIPHQLHLLIVDDNSPDGTAEIVRQFMRTNKQTHLLNGEKRGLGVAYIRGMNYSLNNFHPDAVMEMDADFSHDPKDIPRLIDELQAHDFIIGSRYVEGGKIPESWSFFRKANSRFGNICARYIAGIRCVHDCTAGFRAIRTSILSKINLDSLNAKGYCFQINLLHKAISAGAKVKEIPVEFADRTYGNSKLGISDILEFLYAIWLIRINKKRD